jgi:hypothetical protein
MLNVDSQWHPLLESIENTLRAILGVEDISKYEIKARNLYHRIRRGDPTAKALMSALMKIPSQHLVPVFYGAVDRAGYIYFMREIFSRSVYRERAEERMEDVRPPMDTFGQAFAQCIGRVDSFVHAIFPAEQILWIHDKGRYDDGAKFQLGNVRALGASEIGSHFREVLDDYYLERSHVVDTIYFGDSRESRALQLADACCSTITRQLRGDPDADPYYELLKPQIANDGSRPEYENVEAVWKIMQERERAKKGET